MPADRRLKIPTDIALAVGAVGVLATGADHFVEYAAKGFSSVPTIGFLFLLNFISATLIGIGLLLPWRRLTERFADPLRALLALSGIGIAAMSLIGLWISESSSLFGFTDYGFRSEIVLAIIAESVAIAALMAYLALERPVRLTRGKRASDQTPVIS
ncbi:MAG: hypothetical protein JOZ73_07210 [Solirubrobacterales bacterium]|nr:hypothetical protein [Solirubrobacterales bacterium]